MFPCISLPETGNANPGDIMTVLVIVLVLLAAILSIRLSVEAEMSIDSKGFNFIVRVYLAHFFKLFTWSLKEGGLSFLFKPKAPDDHKDQKKKVNRIFRDVLNPNSLMNMKGLTVFKLKVWGYIATKDAPQTAILYGLVCALVATVLPFIKENRSKIDFYPSFNTHTPDFHINCIISVRIYHIIYLMIQKTIEIRLKGRWHAIWNRTQLKN